MPEMYEQEETSSNGRNIRVGSNLDESVVKRRREQLRSSSRRERQAQCHLMKEGRLTMTLK